MSNAPLTKDTCRQLRDQLQAALDKAFETTGILIHVGNATFNPNSVTFKVEVTPGGEEGKKDQERREFEQLAPIYDLLPEDYGAQIKLPGEARTFTVYGFAKRHSKRPLLARSDGRLYSLPLVPVLRALGRTSAADKRERFLRDFG